MAPPKKSAAVKLPEPMAPKAPPAPVVEKQPPKSPPVPAPPSPDREARIAALAAVKRSAGLPADMAYQVALNQVTEDDSGLYARVRNELSPKPKGD